MNIREKLNEIQVRLKAGKDMNNSFGGFMYRSCESILESLKPFMKEFKLTIRFQDEIVMVGNRFYVKSYVILEDCESDESLTTTAWAREQESKTKMDDAQVTGASSSYARKYALCGMFAIDDNKDPDAYEHDNDNKPEPKKEPNHYIDEHTEERRRMLDDIELARGEEGIKTMCERCGVKETGYLPYDYVKKVWTNLNESLKQKQTQGN